LVYSFLLSLLSLLAGLNNFPIFEMIIPFGIILISVNLDFSKKDLSSLLFYYSILVCLMSILSLYYYGNGFSITEIYLIPSKNQIGPMIVFSAIFFLYIFC
jgi:hypothetical protein